MTSTKTNEKTESFAISHISFGFWSRVEGVSLGKDGKPQPTPIRASFLVECDAGNGLRAALCKLSGGREFEQSVSKTKSGRIVMDIASGPPPEEFDSLKSCSRAELNLWLAESAIRLRAKAQALGVSPALGLCHSTHDVRDAKGAFILPASVASVKYQHEWISLFEQEVFARREAAQIQAVVAASSQQDGAMSSPQKKTPRAL